jgi:hypothetical protein
MPSSAGWPPRWRGRPAESDPLHIGETRRGYRHPVVDRPGQAGGEPHVRCGEASADQKRSPVLQRLLGMTQLRHEILSGAVQCDRGFAIDVLQVAVATHHVEAGRVEFGRHIKTPFEPGRALPRIGWDQRVLGGAIGVGEISDDCRALGDLEVAVLEQRDLLPWVEPGVLRRLSLTGAWQDRPAVIVEAELVQCPMGAQGAAGSDAPQHQSTQRSVAHCYHHSI